MNQFELAIEQARQAYQILGLEYARLLEVLDLVVKGDVHPSRVTVDRANGGWAVTPLQVQPKVEQAEPAAN